MIEPTKITNFSRSPEELIEFLVFAVCVAGKNADSVARKVNALCADEKFMHCMQNYPLEEDGLWEFTMLPLLYQYRIGQYRRVLRALRNIAKISERLHSCDVTELMMVPGVGPKTACFFVLHSRPQQDLVVIDRHILRFYNQVTKRQTRIPQDWRGYLRLARAIARKMRELWPHKTAAEADLDVWKMFSGRMSEAS